MKKEIFGKRFLAVNLQNRLVVTFCYFHSGRVCAHIKAVGKFFFWRRFLRRGRVTDIEETNFSCRNGLVSINFKFE